MAVYQRQSSKEYQLGHKKGAIKGGGRDNGIMGWLAAALWSLSWNETEQGWEIKVGVAGGQGGHQSHVGAWSMSQVGKFASY